KGVLRWDATLQSLVESNTGFPHSPISDLSKGMDRIWAACGNGVFYYNLKTKKWSEKMNLPDHPYYGYQIVSANDQGWVVVYQGIGGVYGVFYFSDDNGGTWEAIEVPEGLSSVRSFLQ